MRRTVKTLFGIRADYDFPVGTFNAPKSGLVAAYQSEATRDLVLSELQRVTVPYTSHSAIPCSEFEARKYGFESDDLLGWATSE